MQWTEEMIVTLKSSIAQGCPASYIGAQLGLTRSAVLGKMNRLGLVSEHVNYGARGKAISRKGKKKTRYNHIPNLSNFAEKPHHREKHKLLETVRQIKWGQLDSALNVSFEELNSTHCRWPMWGEGVNHFDKRYCGCGVFKFPYCGYHSNRSARQIIVDAPEAPFTTHNSSAKSPKLMMR